MQEGITVKSYSIEFVSAGSKPVRATNSDMIVMSKESSVRNQGHVRKEQKSLVCAKSGKSRHSSENFFEVESVTNVGRQDIIHGSIGKSPQKMWFLGGECLMRMRLCVPRCSTLNHF